MPKFIALTETPRGGKIIVRSDYIVYVCRTQHSDKTDTYVRYATDLNMSQKAGTPTHGGGGWFFVKESVEEVERLLND